MKTDVSIIQAKTDGARCGNENIGDYFVIVERKTNKRIAYFLDLDDAIEYAKTKGSFYIWVRDGEIISKQK